MTDCPMSNDKKAVFYSQRTFQDGLLSKASSNPYGWVCRGDLQKEE
jgi:hypothetical protein